MAAPATWGETGDVASLLEASYRLDLDEDPWLQGMQRAFAPLVPGSLDALAASYVWPAGDEPFRFTHMVGQDANTLSRVADTAPRAGDEFLATIYGVERRVYTFLDMLGERLRDLPVGADFAALGIVDLLALRIWTPGRDRQGIVLGAPAAERIELAPSGRATWERIAAHLAAALRLRRGTADAHPVESVVAPDGRIAHAEGEARSDEAREALGRAVLAIDRARQREARSDPRALLEAWRAIVAQRWSLIDVVESDGKRFMLARVNPPAAVSDSALTARERQVAALLVQGVAQKAVGYELSMAPSTVSFHTSNIARKVGATSSTELVRLLATRAATETSAAATPTLRGSR